MPRTITDSQDREWQVSVEEGAIIARTDGRTRVYYGSVGVRDLPSEEGLEEIIQSYDWGRRIEDQDGTEWLVTSQRRPSTGLDFQQMTGDREHWHPTTDLEDLEEYSDEELVEMLGENR